MVPARIKDSPAPTEIREDDPMTTTWPDPPTRTDLDGAAGLRILIAEDVADCANSTAALLRMHGHRVKVARSGPAALELAEAHRPDVLFLDIGLPGMSGYEVAERLKGRRWRKKPLIVALTGYAREADRLGSAEAGIDLYLVKPVKPEQLRALLTRFQRVVGPADDPAEGA